MTTRERLFVVGLLVLVAVGCGPVPPDDDATVKTVCTAPKVHAIEVDFDADCDNMRTILALAVEDMRPVIGPGDKATDFLDGIVIRIEDACTIMPDEPCSGGHMIGWTVPGYVRSTADMRSIAHELFHIIDGDNLVINSWQHPHWDTNGYFKADDAFRLDMDINRLDGKTHAPTK